MHTLERVIGGKENRKLTTTNTSPDESPPAIYKPPSWWDTEPAPRDMTQCRDTFLPSITAEVWDAIMRKVGTRYLTMSCDGGTSDGLGRHFLVVVLVVERTVLLLPPKYFKTGETLTGPTIAKALDELLSECGIRPEAIRWIVSDRGSANMTAFEATLPNAGDRERMFAVNTELDMTQSPQIEPGAVQKVAPYARFIPCVGHVLQNGVHASKKDFDERWPHAMSALNHFSHMFHNAPTRRARFIEHAQWGSSTSGELKKLEEVKTHLLACQQVLSVSTDEVLRDAVAGVVASLPDLASFVARDPVSSINSLYDEVSSRIQELLQRGKTPSPVTKNDTRWLSSCFMCASYFLQHHRNIASFLVEESKRDGAPDSVRKLTVELTAPAVLTELTAYVSVVGVVATLVGKYDDLPRSTALACDVAGDFEKCISSLRKHSGATEAIAQGLADALLEKWVVSGAASFFAAVRWLHPAHVAVQCGICRKDPPEIASLRFELCMESLTPASLGKYVALATKNSRSCLEFWESLVGSADPELSFLASQARDAVLVPPVVTTCDSIISAEGALFSRRQKKMTDEHASKLLFIRCNRGLFVRDEEVDQ